MIRVPLTFDRWDPSVDRCRELGPDTVVAWMRVAGERAPRTVRLGRLCLFDDLVASTARGAQLDDVVRASVHHTRWGVVEDERPGEVSLSRRFDVSDADDGPSWIVRVGRNCGQVDLHLLRHVLGWGEGDVSRARRTWEQWLGAPLPRDRDVEASFERLGIAARRLVRQEGVTSLYAGLAMSRRRAGAVVLAEVRERWLAWCHDALQQARRGQDHRHVHLGRTHSAMLWAATAPGALVVARGRHHGALSLRTAYDVRSGADAALSGDATRRKIQRRWDREGRSGYTVTVHVPDAWGCDVH